MRLALILLPLLLVGCSKPPTAPAAGRTYEAKVIKVIDGDSIKVSVPAWKGIEALETVALRVYGIDTPEKMKRFAKCDKEVRLGILATTYARTLAKEGDTIKFTYRGKDKYFRIDADVITADGDKWADKMISKGFARPYFGATKSDWCT